MARSSVAPVASAGRFLKLVRKVDVVIDEALRSDRSDSVGSSMAYTSKSGEHFVDLNPAKDRVRLDTTDTRRFNNLPRPEFSEAIGHEDMVVDVQVQESGVSAVGVLALGDKPDVSFRRETNPDGRDVYSFWESLPDLNGKGLHTRVIIQGADLVVDGQSKVADLPRTYDESFPSFLWPEGWWLAQSP